MRETHQRPQAGDVRHGPAQRHGNLGVGARHHPRRSALVELKFGDLPDDLRHDLDRAGAGADHRHPLAGQVDAVVPFGRMESGTTEFVAALDVGQGRDVQRARARDQELPDEFAAVFGEDVPALLVVVPVGSVDVRIELDVAAQPVFLGDSLEVVPDLGLIGERVLPVGLGLERERVQVRRDVAGAAGVTVVAPRAADVVELLQDDEVHALLLQLDRHSQAGEAGPDDDGAGVDGLVWRMSARLVSRRRSW